MSARMNPSRQLALGFLIVSTLTLLAYYTVFLTESSLFGDKYQITVTFEQARGLRAGDTVLVAGVRWGRVAEVEYDSNAEIDERITVTATLTHPVQLREDGWFRIEDSTLLGGRVLSINPGTPGAAPLPKDTVFRGEVITSPLDAMGEFLTENSDDFKEAFGDLGELLKNANEGGGVIGKLLKDEKLATNFEETMANIAATTDIIRKGEGTLGRLLVANDLYKSLQRSAASLEESLANVEKTTKGIEAGEGTIGALLKDKDLKEKVQDIVAKIDTVTEGLKAGKGTLGMLLQDDTIFKNARDLTGDLAAVAAKIRAGEGNLGRLVMEEDLYVEIERALGLITLTLEEYREAAPVTTLTSVLFNAF